MKNNHGFALAYVLIIMFILMVASVTILSMSLSETKLAMREEEKTKAYYIARSGAEAASLWLSNATNSSAANVDSLISNNNLNVDTWTNFPDSTNPATGRFKISFHGTRKSPLIESIGEYHGIQSTVRLYVKSNPLFSNNSPVTILSNLSLQPNNHIYDQYGNDGNVTLATDATISGNGAKNIHIVNRIYTDLGPYPLEVNGIDTPDVQRPWTAPSSAITNSSAGYVGKHFKGSVNKGVEQPIDVGTLTFDLTSDMAIQFNSLSAEQITVKGTGVLTIYVNDIQMFSSGGSIETMGNAKLVLYILTANESTIKGPKTKFQGLIYAPLAKVNFEANGGVFGGVIANIIDMQVGSIMYDPNEVDVDPTMFGISLGYSKNIWSN